jgi:hypothetical protein
MLAELAGLRRTWATVDVRVAMSLPWSRGLPRTPVGVRDAEDRGQVREADECGVERNPGRYSLSLWWAQPGVDAGDAHACCDQIGSFSGTVLRP